MIRRTSRSEESNTSSKQLKKEATMYSYHDSGYVALSSERNVRKADQLES